MQFFVEAGKKRFLAVSQHHQYRNSCEERKPLARSKFFRCDQGMSRKGPGGVERREVCGGKTGARRSGFSPYEILLSSLPKGVRGKQLFSQVD